MQYQKSENDGVVGVEEYAMSFSDVDLVRRLGGGAYGSVYECETDSGKMACKFMLEKYYKGTQQIDSYDHVANTVGADFLREASVYSYLGNAVPGVCNVREIGAGYLGMCLERGDLASETNKVKDIIYTRRKNLGPPYRLGLSEISGRLPLMDAGYVIESIASLLTTLEILHGMGIAHFDIKPQNILVTSKGSWKLCDFGISRKIRPEDERIFKKMKLLYNVGERVDGNGKALIKNLFLTDGDSSLLYAAPETLHRSEHGLKPVFTISDIWSVGALFYLLLTGLDFVETISYRDQTGDVITRDVAHVLDGLLKGNEKTAYVLNMLRFLTEDMKRSGMDFHHSGWESYVDTLNKTDISDKGSLSTVSPSEVIRRMRPELHSQHEKIWNVLVNMLDPNPLTRWTAAQCLESDLFRPYKHKRRNMFSEFLRKSANNSRPEIYPSTDDTLLMRFSASAMGKDDQSAKGWVRPVLTTLPGMRPRMERMLSIINSKVGHNLKDLYDVRLVFFCVYQLSFIAEYGVFTPNIMSFNPLHGFLDGIDPPAETFHPSYSSKELYRRINYTLYYIVVEILKFNLWM